MSADKFNSLEYRRALGCFATGVAVITAVTKDGGKAGITVNSFNSVSLDPPLVLWSIDLDAGDFDAFMEAENFAVNVLGANQQEICARCASSGNNKFNGIDCHDGVTGVPVLPEFSAVFECQTENIYDGGDHKIIIGRVLSFEDRKTDPLIFYRGHFLE